MTNNLADRCEVAGEVEPVAWMNPQHGEPGYYSLLSPVTTYRIKGWAPLYTHPAPPADVVELVEALRELLHAYCSDTGFAAAVRQDTGLAYPWAPGEIAEARARAALAKHGGA